MNAPMLKPKNSISNIGTSIQDISSILIVAFLLTTSFGTDAILFNLIMIAYGISIFLRSHSETEKKGLYISIICGSIIVLLSLLFQVDPIKGVFS